MKTIKKFKKIYIILIVFFAVYLGISIAQNEYEPDQIAIDDIAFTNITGAELNTIYRSDIISIT